jgi:hypothetical protein
MWASLSSELKTPGGIYPRGSILAGIPRSRYNQSVYTLMAPLLQDGDECGLRRATGLLS